MFERSKNIVRQEVDGSKSSRFRKRVPEFTSERDEGMKILVNSCIREFDRIGVRENR